MSQTDVLMACYNGEKYIRQQIDSILNQTYKDWRLLVSDDGSTDGTADIIDEYCAAHPDKIVRLRSGRRCGNAGEHFVWLMSQSQADYMFFADQDDVWLPKKMEKSVETMEAAEDENNKSMPILVYTDLTVTDVDMNVTAESLMKLQQQQPLINDYRELLFQNVITGNTMFINCALADKALKCVDTKSVSMHDWWVGIVAARFGKTCFVDEQTVLYRQHNDNSVGAQNTRHLSYLFQKLTKQGSVAAYADSKAKQSEVFRDTYNSELNSDEQTLLAALAKRKLTLRQKMNCLKLIHSFTRKVSVFLLW